MRRATIAVSLALIAAGSVSCDGGAQTMGERSAVPTSTGVTPSPLPTYADGALAITISDMRTGFQPRDRVLEVGAVVRFTNTDPSALHSFTQVDGAWDSGLLAAGAPPFEKAMDLPPGRYFFKCKAHDYITQGVIMIVEEMTDLHDDVGSP